MDEVKKIEHCKILNTDTPDNSASDLDSFLKKNKKNKEMSEIVAGTILQLLRQTQDSQFSTLGKKNGHMESIDNKSSLQLTGIHLFLCKQMEQRNFLQRKFSI